MKKSLFFAVLVLLLCSVSYVSAETYQYDKLNRLTKVIYEDGSYISYEYDASGNLSKIIRTTAQGNRRTYLLQ